ncbi:MAG: hypothetical protein GEU77_10420, partial [Deltaproteobacteria bacterium]|nr:hypothetical protein [Deltaproteobacteria bacterium]
MGTVATLYFLAGLAGYVHSPFANLVVVIVLAASALFFLVHFFALPFATNWVGRWIWAALLVILIAEVLLGFLPPTARDE